MDVITHANGMAGIKPCNCKCCRKHTVNGVWKVLMGMQIALANLKNSLNVFMKLRIYSPHKSTISVKTERLKC